MDIRSNSTLIQVLVISELWKMETSMASEEMEKEVILCACTCGMR